MTVTNKKIENYQLFRFKKIETYQLFRLFIEWAVNNNWIEVSDDTCCLTPEGADELEALGLEISKLLNGKKKVAKNNEEELKVNSELQNNKQTIAKVHLYTDGGSRGNQFASGGLAAIGIIVCNDQDEVITTHKQYLGKATNNQAEYMALITGLNLLKNYHVQEVTCCSDSQLMINQLNGTYKIKDKTLQKMVIKVKELEHDFRCVTYIHQPRENKILQKADKLVNQVLDAQGV